MRTYQKTSEDITKIQGAVATRVGVLGSSAGSGISISCGMCPMVITKIIKYRVQRDYCRENVSLFKKFIDTNMQDLYDLKLAYLKIC